MDYFKEDSVMTEIRKNRAELLAEFNGDTFKYFLNCMEQEKTLRNQGRNFESPESLAARKAWHRQQQEAEQRRAAL
ncbi:MAG: hypothetical protein LBR85_04685 [Oscillospiraceae bacterium]|jgi:hypothetical protein|nr:hypothetical protein [Oscillospiraceae bacterium]